MIENGFDATPPSPSKPIAIRLGFALCSSALLAGLAYGSARVVALEHNELELQTPPTTLRERASGVKASAGSARLASVWLRKGQTSQFELCSADRLEATRWADTLELAIVHLETHEWLVRVPLDRASLARVRRDREGGCLTLGSGPIERSGTYEVEAISSGSPLRAALLDVPLTIRVVARTPLRRSDLWTTLLLGLSILSTLWLALAAAPSGDSEAVGRASWRNLASIAVALAILYGASELPLFGASMTLLKGCLLFGAQVALAWRLARDLDGNGRARALGLVAPTQVVRALACTVCAWPLLVGSARLALRWVPSTGEAPIESFIAWPSGMLATALLGVLLPAAEELFFRGYLYGALLPFGRLAAALFSVLLFGLLHVEQSWGNWGGLVAVFAVGTVLCALRIISGSTLITAICHVAYNLTLSITSIAASLRS